MIKKIIWIFVAIASLSFTSASLTTPQIDFSFDYLRDSLPTDSHKNYVHYRICQTGQTHVSNHNLRASIAFYQQGKLIRRKPDQLFNQWSCLVGYINIHSARACGDTPIYAVIESDIDSNRTNNRSQDLVLRKLDYAYTCWLGNNGRGGGWSWWWGSQSQKLTANDYDYRIQNIQLKANNNAKVQVCRDILDTTKNYSNKNSTASFLFTNGWRTSSNTFFHFTKDHECIEKTLSYSNLVAQSNIKMQYMARWVIQTNDANPANNMKDVWLADTRPIIDPYNNPHAGYNSWSNSNWSNNSGYAPRQNNIDLYISQSNFTVSQSDVTFSVCSRAGSYDGEVQIGIGGKYETRYYSSAQGCMPMKFPLSKIDDIHKGETVIMRAMVKLPNDVTTHVDSNSMNNAFTDYTVLIHKYSDAAEPTVDNYCYYGQGDLCSTYTPSQPSGFGNTYVWNGWRYGVNSWSSLYTSW